MFKFKKIIAIVSVFVIIICFVLIPVNAESVSVDFDGGLSLSAVSVVILDSNGDSVGSVSIAPNVSTTGLPNTESLSIWVNGGALSQGDYLFVLSFIADEYLINGDKYCIGGFDFRMFDHIAKFAKKGEYPKVRRINTLDNTMPTQYGSANYIKETINGTNLETWKVYFSQNSTGTSYNQYICALPFELLTSTQNFKVFISNLDFELITEDEAAQNREEEKANQQGQESVDELGSAIDNKSDGFVNALNSLVSAMSYEGTECAWTFPSLKLPAIDGVMPEYKLTDEKPINFEFWVNKIPTNILNLVRAVCTIALIVYCFKELYGTISYVLTLKGGGNSNE